MERNSPRDALALELFSLRPRLLRFAGRFVTPQWRAEELIDATLLELIERWDYFQAGSNLFAWACTAVRNNAMSGLRKGQRRQRLEPQLIEIFEGVPHPDPLVNLDLEFTLICLARLSPEQQESLLLIAYDGKQYNEVAEMLGVAEGTIKSRVRRARDKLIELMDQPANATAAL